MPPCGVRLKRPGKIVDSGKMDTMSNDSPVDAAHDLSGVESTPRAGKLVEQVDRFFFVVWLGIYALLPTSGWASVMFAGWLDQKRDLAALRSVISVGHADAIAHNGIGPAYIARSADRPRDSPAEPGGLARPAHEGQLRAVGGAAVSCSCACSSGS